jgi:penicillin-insensitive murein endopeptidase
MMTEQKIRAAVLAFTVAFLAPDAVSAQTRGTVNPQPLPALAKPDDPATPAKELFGRQSMPAPAEARVIGFYSKGCLAGAKALPINGKTWQVMRLSRNRNWGHPSLVQFLERLADKGPKVGWRGLLVGDLSQARGGPMLTGPLQPSNRPRRRHLANADARSRAYPARARGDVGDHDGCR